MKLKSEKSARSIIAWVIAGVLAAAWLILSIVPFIFMVLNSFKDRFEMLVKGVFQLPKTLNTSNYDDRSNEI